MEIWAPGRDSGLCPRASEIARGDGGPVAGTEQPGIRTRAHEVLEVIDDGRDDVGWQREDPRASVGLRGPQHGPPACQYHPRLRDPDRAV